MNVDTITSGERRELRSVVRQQMKVLRTEIKQRRYELVAQAEARLREKYRDEDRLADELGARIAKLTAEVNLEIQALLVEYGQVTDGRWGAFPGFAVPYIRRGTGDRDQLHQAMVAGINAQVQQAQLQLDRQEADLLRELSMEALESDAARKFLTRIPTMADLVPSRRLREIEAQFDARDAR